MASFRRSTTTRKSTRGLAQAPSRAFVRAKHVISVPSKAWPSKSAQPRCSCGPGFFVGHEIAAAGLHQLTPAAAVQLLWGIQAARVQSTQLRCEFSPRSCGAASAGHCVRAGSAPTAARQLRHTVQIPTSPTNLAAQVPPLCFFVLRLRAPGGPWRICHACNAATRYQVALSRFQHLT